MQARNAPIRLPLQALAAFLNRARCDFLCAFAMTISFCLLNGGEQFDAESLDAAQVVSSAFADARPDACNNPWRAV